MEGTNIRGIKPFLHGFFKVQTLYMQWTLHCMTHLNHPKRISKELQELLNFTSIFFIPTPAATSNNFHHTLSIPTSRKSMAFCSMQLLQIWPSSPTSPPSPCSYRKVSGVLKVNETLTIGTNSFHHLSRIQSFALIHDLIQGDWGLKPQGIYRVRGRKSGATISLTNPCQFGNFPLRNSHERIRFNLITMRYRRCTSPSAPRFRHPGWRPGLQRNHHSDWHHRRWKFEATTMLVHQTVTSPASPKGKIQGEEKGKPQQTPIWWKFIDLFNSFHVFCQVGAPSWQVAWQQQARSLV